MSILVNRSFDAAYKPPLSVPVDRSHWAVRRSLMLFAMRDRTVNVLRDELNRMTLGVTGTPTVAMSPGGLGRNFEADDTEGYYTTLSSPIIAGLPLCVMAWCTPESLHTGQLIAIEDGTTSYSQITLRLQSGGDILGSIRTEEVTGPTPTSAVQGGSYAAGERLFVAMVGDLTSTRLYVNGVEVDTDTPPVDPVFNEDLVKYGCGIWRRYNDTLIQPFDGTIEFAALLDYAPTATEVREFYRNPFAIYSPRRMVITEAAASSSSGVVGSSIIGSARQPATGGVFGSDVIRVLA